VTACDAGVWNPSPDPRWDMVACNITAGATGAVEVEASTRWGYLDTSVCTLFANIAKLDISAVDAAKPSIVELFLRAHPASC
jgi:hypothetical protein